MSSSVDNVRISCFEFALYFDIRISDFSRLVSDFSNFGIRSQNYCSEEELL